MAGFYLADLSVMALALLLWGTWEQRAWALWGSAAYYGVLAAAWIVTFARTPYAALLAWLQAAVHRDEILRDSARGWEIGAFVGLPMLVCAGAALACRWWLGSWTTSDARGRPSAGVRLSTDSGNGLSG